MGAAGIHFDPSFSVSDIILVGGIFYSLIKVRDGYVKLTGKVDEISKRLDSTEGTIGHHNHFLITLGLQERRHP